MVPYVDQWAFLASIKRLDENKLNLIIQNAVKRNELLPVVYDPYEAEDETKPWERKSAVPALGSMTGCAAFPAITEPLPLKAEIVLSDQLYINYTGLPPVLRNRILHLTSFANPEFYRA